MRHFLTYLENNAIILLFAVAVVLLIYTAGRFLKLPEGISIVLALAPFGFAWGYSNGMFPTIFG